MRDGNHGGAPLAGALAAVWLAAVSGARGRDDRHRGFPGADRRCRHLAFRPQQAPCGPDGLPARQDAPLRAWHVAGERGDVRSADRRRLVDGSCRASGLRRLSGRRARVRPLVAAAGNEPTGRSQCARDDDRGRGEGPRNRNRFRPAATPSAEARSDGLVLGHRDGGCLYGGQQRQDQPPGALCVGLASVRKGCHDREPAAARRPMPPGRPTRRARTSKRARRPRRWRP